MSVLCVTMTSAPGIRLAAVMSRLPLGMTSSVARERVPLRAVGLKPARLTRGAQWAPGVAVRSSPALTPASRSCCLGGSIIRARTQAVVRRRHSLGPFGRLTCPGSLMTSVSLRPCPGRITALPTPCLSPITLPHGNKPAQKTVHRKQQARHRALGRAYLHVGDAHARYHARLSRL